MLQLFTKDLKVFTRILTPDSAGGDSIEYLEALTKWRVRVTPIGADYVENAPSREYPEKIKLVGEIRNGLSEGDLVEFGNKHWEITSLVEVRGIGSIPDYFRAEATCISEVEE